MRERMEQVWNGALDLVYPPRCLVCGVRMEEGALCAVCHGDFKPMLPPFCDRCGTPVAAGELVCGPCATGPEPAFAWSQAMGEYGGTLRQAIHRFKYDGKAALAAPLGSLLADFVKNSDSPLLPANLEAETPAFDVVVPIPLHPAKLRQRGFNQAERLARVVSQQCGWRLDADGLRRIRPTRTQTHLSLTERAANVSGVFAVRDSARFANRSVLLIDDVLTTSATVREAARVLRETGTTRICVVALARGG